MLTPNIKSLIDKLDPPLRATLEGAAGLALTNTHYHVEIEHWLLKLLEQNEHSLHTVLKKTHIDDSTLSQLQRAIAQDLQAFRQGNGRAPALSSTLIELLRESWMLTSLEWRQSQITVGALLTTLLLDEQLRHTLPCLQTLDAINAEVLRQPPSTPDIVDSKNGTNAPENISDHPALDRYTVNLTAQAAAGKIDPVLGRDTEIRQLIDVLMRRRQNNPILTGEAGVGKTAVVEGFALRVAQNDIPEPLQGVSVRALDLGLLQAGAGMKGEFESRLRAVIDEIKASPQSIILFIDEAHTLIGAGGKEGQNDAANLLKPALARGELRTIAATTWAEYKKYFERDPALTRRFQVVKIEEPDGDNAVGMMRGIVNMLEEHHKVRILDEAVVQAVKLSQRYIAARQLPDKAVSLLDTACAKVALSLVATPAAIQDGRRTIDQIERTLSLLERENATHGGCEERLNALHLARDNARRQLDRNETQWAQEKTLIDRVQALQADIEADITHAPPPQRNYLDTHENHLQQKQQQRRAELQSLTAALKEIQGDQAMMHPTVNAQAIAEVIAQWTGIPIGRMVADEIHAVQHLATRLQARVIGQDHALHAIADAVRTARAGLTDIRKPLGVFFMVGPSGVGKTETALALAELLYGDNSSVTAINMSEFKEAHKVSMLTGSPPGYVGYGEGGVLTEAVRRKPYSIVLLDEMEKAHPSVQDVFYNVFDKGTLKDGEGRDIDFRHTLIIMTSNAGEEAIRHLCKNSMERLPSVEYIVDNFRPELLKSFKPAFLGRCEIIPYYPLSDDHLVKICEITLQRLAMRVKEHYAAHLSYDNAVPQQIVARSKEVDTGARSIEHIVSRTLMPALAGECLAHMAQAIAIRNIHVHMDEKGAFRFQTVSD